MVTTVKLFRDSSLLVHTRYYACRHPSPNMRALQPLFYSKPSLESAPDIVQLSPNLRTSSAGKTNTMKRLPWEFIDGDNKDTVDGAKRSEGNHSAPVMLNVSAHFGTYSKHLA